MSQKEPLPKFLEGASRSYEVFLCNVRLLHYDSKRKPDADGLHHARLQIGPGVRLREPYRLLITADEPSYWFDLSWEHNEALNPLTETIRQIGRFCPGISRQTIEEELIKLFEDIVYGGSLTDAALDKLKEDTENDSRVKTQGVDIGPFLEVTDLRDRLYELTIRLRKLAIPHNVYVPIEGLELSRSITVGDVVFERRETGCELELVMDVMQGRPRTRSIEWVRKDIIPDSRVKSFAKINIEGEGAYVIEESRKRVTNAISVLSLCIPSHLHRPAWAKISTTDVIIVRRKPTSEIEVDWMGFFLADTFGRVRKLNWNHLVDEIGARSKPRFASKPEWKRQRPQEDNAVKHVLDGLYQAFDDRRGISESFGRALTWYGKAMTFKDPSEQFVGLAIALESLIGRRGQSTEISRASALSITQTISERTAFLLGNDYKERMKWYRDAARLYDLRSKIVHDGIRVSEEDVFELEGLVKDVFLVFFTKGFQSWDDVRKWMNERVFTTKVDVLSDNVEEEE